MNAKILHNLRGIVTPRADLAFGELDIREEMAIYIENERIKEIDKLENLKHKFPKASLIDGQGCWALPGYVDPHTHPVFYRTRESEFEMRIQGKSYQEIAGI